MSHNPQNPVHEQWFTSAPDAYDYGYTQNVRPAQHYAYEGCKPLHGRIVCIPEDRVTYQTERYLSGMYVAERMKQVLHDYDHQEVPDAEHQHAS